MIYNDPQIKIFSSYKTGELEKSVNAWLTENWETVEIIQYGHAAASTGDSNDFAPALFITIWYRERC